VTSSECPRRHHRFPNRADASIRAEFRPPRTFRRDSNKRYTIGDPQWEIIDYAHDDKIDAPSGTARELAERLSKVRHPDRTVPIDQTIGARESRGASVAGSQIHSLRLPGYVISAEIVFGMPDQRLSIRHDSGSSAVPYVDGALLAIRKVPTLIGVHRGLDSVLDLGLPQSSRTDGI
jgi:dihydrodipicolinate reductase